jgi:hypothetical protein
MTSLTIALAALLAAAPAGAQDAPAKAAPDAKLQTLLESCDAHKFETTVETTVDGKPHRSKVKMCGKEGQSDADWITTLKDAIAKLEANEGMDPAVRSQIVDAVNAEISRIETGGTHTAAAPPPLKPRAQAAPAPLAEDYSVLPPLPTPKTPSRSAAPATAATANGVVAAAPAAPRILAPVVAAPKPRLAFTCISPDYPAGGECISFSRDTIVSVKAGEAVADPLSLQFMRNGETRADVPLGSFRKGERVRFELPRQVCSGVSSAEIQMNVIRSGQVVDRMGPYLLRC